MDWFLYDKDLRYERVKTVWLMTEAYLRLCQTLMMELFLRKKLAAKSCDHFCEKAPS